MGKRFPENVSGHSVKWPRSLPCRIDKAGSKILGKGAGGKVFLARSAQTPRLPLAVKVIQANAFTEAADVLKSAQREYVIGSCLRHPNLLRSIAYGEDHNTQKAYIVMPYLEILDERTLKLPAAVRGALIAMFTGLAHVHRHGIVHNDLSMNIKLGKNGYTIIDWGKSERNLPADKKEAGFKRDIEHALTFANSVVRRYAQWASPAPEEYLGLLGAYKAFTRSEAVLLWRRGIPPPPQIKTIFPNA